MMGVRIIHKNNTGVSHSRNVGIDRAAGTYIQFVDGDDWLVKKTVKTKRKLFAYYKALYQSMDLYEKNRMRLWWFYFAFAMDRTQKVS